MAKPSGSPIVGAAHLRRMGSTGFLDLDSVKKMDSNSGDANTFSTEDDSRTSLDPTVLREVSPPIFKPSKTLSSSPRNRYRKTRDDAFVEALKSSARDDSHASLDPTVLREVPPACTSSPSKSKPNNKQRRRSSSFSSTSNLPSFSSTSNLPSLTFASSTDLVNTSNALMAGSPRAPASRRKQQPNSFSAGSSHGFAAEDSADLVNSPVNSSNALIAGNPSPRAQTSRRKQQPNSFSAGSSHVFAADDCKSIKSSSTQKKMKKKKKKKKDADGQSITSTTSSRRGRSRTAAYRSFERRKSRTNLEEEEYERMQDSMHQERKRSNSLTMTPVITAPKNNNSSNSSSNAGVTANLLAQMNAKLMDHFNNTSMSEDPVVANSSVDSSSAEFDPFALKQQQQQQQDIRKNRRRSRSRQEVDVQDSPGYRVAASSSRAASKRNLHDNNNSSNTNMITNEEEWKPFG